MTRKRRRGFNGRRGAPRQRRQPTEVTLPVPTQREQISVRQREEHERMRTLIAVVQQRLDREATRDFALAQRYENEPMIEGSVAVSGAATAAFTLAMTNHE